MSLSTNIGVKVLMGMAPHAHSDGQILIQRTCNFVQVNLPSGEIAYGQDGNKKTAKHKAARSEFFFTSWLRVKIELKRNNFHVAQICLTSLMVKAVKVKRNNN